MHPDDVQLEVLKSLWQKAEMRDAFQKLVAHSISQAAVPVSVPQLMSILGAMDSLLEAEPEEEEKKTPENI